MADVRLVALLRPHLHDPAIAPGGSHHCLSLIDEEVKGLLAVDVLARLAGHDGGEGVPMVRRGDHDGVYVVAVQHVAEVPVDIGTPACRLHNPRRALGPAEMHVANRHDAATGIAGEAIEVAAAHASQSDVADPNRGVGAGHLGPGGSVGPGRARDRCPCSESLQEIPTGDGPALRQCRPSSVGV